jgi:hypothetical protein
MFNNFLWNSCPLWDNVEKYGRAGQAIDDNIIRRMRFAYWITKATDTHIHNMQKVLFLYGSNGSANAPKYYVIRTLQVLLFFPFGQFIGDVRCYCLYIRSICRSCLRLCNFYCLMKACREGSQPLVTSNFSICPVSFCGCIRLLPSPDPHVSNIAT